MREIGPVFLLGHTRLNPCVESNVFRRDEGNRGKFSAGGRREPRLP